MSIEEIAQKLSCEESVALFVHVRPDGDTVGSATALKFALIKKGIKAEVFSSDDIPKKFHFLPEVKTVKRELDGEYSAFVAIDNAELLRLGIFAEPFKAHKNTYSVDHHVSNTFYAKYNYVCDKASNAENVLALINAMNIPLDATISNLLATGILTDTGNFHHKNVTPETLIDAAELVRNGADLDRIYFHTFSEQTKERAKLFAITMDKLRYFMDGKIAVASVRKDYFALSGARQEDTEGFIDFVMGIKGVEVGVCIMETDVNKFKISFRSRKADVNAVAQIFGGGGHVLASGCQINGDYEEVVDKIRFAVSKYIDE